MRFQRQTKRGLFKTNHQVRVLPSQSLDGVSTANAQAAGSTNLRHWRVTGFVVIFIGLSVLFLTGFIREDDWWVPGTFITASGLVLLPTMRRVLRQGGQEVLADHLLVLAGAFLLYNVFGALLIPFGPRDQAESALSYYWMDAQMAMRVTAINCLGFGLTLVSSSLVRRHWVSKRTGTAIGFGQHISQRWVIVAFLLVGGASALYVLEFELSLQPGVVPGIVRTLSRLLLVAIMMAAAYRGRGSRWLLVAAIALTALQALGGLLLLSKLTALLPLVALFAGLAWRLGARRVMVPAVATLSAVFLLIGNPVSTARNISARGDQVDWGERTEVLREGVLDPGSARQDDSYQSWARLCYLPAQAAAIDFYDAGRGGDDFGLLGWVFLPRFLLPAKPSMTSSGTEFHDKVTGRDTTSVGLGVFVDGYYNLGWWGVVLVGIAVGGILAWTSAVAAVVYRARASLWMPMALLGSLMAFRIDGSFLADYWGPFVLSAYVVFGGALMQRMIARKRA